MRDDPNNLRSLWSGLLDIYSIFADICERNGLVFYLTDGNAIGAVRHQGFIPWDDDLDVSMPRPDYERFLEIASSELPSFLKIVNWKNTPEFDCMFTKIQDCRREKIESIEKKIGFKLSNGLFIDIFPIDGYPDEAVKRICYYIKIKMLWLIRRFFVEKFSEQKWKGKMAWLLGGLLRFVFPQINSLSSCLYVANELNKSHPYGKTTLTGRSATTMWKRFILPCSVYGEPVYFDYEENYKVPLPRDYDTFLRYDYPNYMMLPPEDKRHPTHSYSDYCPWWLGPTKT